MSRSGYSEEGEMDQWSLIRWRGAVGRAIRGKRGQAFLKELLEALDALPEKRLIADALVCEDGSCCAMGALALKRGIDVSDVDPHEPSEVAGTFGIAEALAQEISWENDSRFGTQEARFAWMRKWVESKIKEPKP